MPNPASTSATAPPANRNFGCKYHAEACGTQSPAGLRTSGSMQMGLHVGGLEPPDAKGSVPAGHFASIGFPPHASRNKFRAEPGFKLKGIF